MMEVERPHTEEQWNAINADWFLLCNAARARTQAPRKLIMRAAMLVGRVLRYPLLRTGLQAARLECADRAALCVDAGLNVRFWHRVAPLFNVLECAPVTWAGTIAGVH